MEMYAEDEEDVRQEEELATLSRNDSVNIYLP